MKVDVKNIQWNAVASAREMLIWGLVLCVVLFFGAKKFFTPLSQKVETAKSQLLAKQMELDAYKKFLKSGNAASKKSLEGMDMNRQMMAQKVKDAFGNVNMSPDVVVSEILSALTNPAYSKAALLDKFNFVGEKKQSGYSEMGLDLKLTGTYNGIAQYLDFIHKLPYLIRIESISIKNKEGQNPQSKVEIAAKAILYVGEPKVLENIAQANSNSDMATDVLVEITGGKVANTPFSAKPRDMTNWSVHELKLTSTMAGGARPTALINGKVFTLGDVVADFELVEVLQREVILKRGDVKHVLKIDEDMGVGTDSAPVLSHTNEAASPEEAPKILNHEKNNEAVAGNNPSDNAQEGAGQNSPSSAEKGSEAGAEGSSASAQGPTSGDSAGGAASGSPGNPNPNAPQEYSEEQKKIFSDNKYGTQTRTETPEEEVEAQSGGGGGANPDPITKKSKLDPNSVEDIEGVPFDDLEDVFSIDADA